jgi:thiol-disulfide isomerase/thioredoxin
LNLFKAYQLHDTHQRNQIPPKSVLLALYLYSRKEILHMRSFFFLVFCSLHSLVISQTKITINIPSYTGDTLYVGTEAESKHTVLEKLVRKTPSEKFVFTIRKDIGESVLYAQKPGEKKAYQFLYMPTDSDFEIIVENKDKLKIQFVNHPKNTAFFSKLDKVVKLSYRNADSLNTHQQIDELLTDMHGETLVGEIDALLAEIADRPAAMYYFTTQLLNVYPTQHIGFDKAYIHIVDNYVKTGKSKFSTEEISAKSSQADDYRITLGNKILPDFTVYKENKESVSLHGINSKFTILIFWSPTCNHCQKAMPHVVSFMDKYKNEDVKVLAICDKGGDKVGTCWPFVLDKKMGTLINGADENRDYNSKLRMRKVPKIFILDKNKKILLKDFNIIELEKYYNYSKTKWG